MPDKAKTPQELALEQLQHQLEEQHKKMQATELMIAELKRQSKPAFIERKPVRAFMHVVRAVTAPFAALHEDNAFALDHPQRFMRDKLITKAERELGRCKEVPDRNHRYAKNSAVRAAVLVMRLEDEDAKSEWPAARTICVSLRQEIERLRPLKTEEQKKKEKETKDKMTELIDKVMSMPTEEAALTPVSSG